MRIVPAGKGRDIANSVRLEAGKMFKQQNMVLVILLIASLIMPWWAFNHYSKENPLLGGLMFFSFSILGLGSLVAYVLFLNVGKRMGAKLTSPKVIIDNFGRKTAPFFDATGAHAGAFLGDVLHDPFQTGGLGTPAHERVVAGMIHKAHMGVLF
ncbi:TPA: ATP-dependent protease LonB, partial [Candidatus Woesearchaeota archaeon]|nr:ATP-dependent protease LonB [Candidatus Woesearchaeota archaeon]